MRGDFSFEGLDIKIDLLSYGKYNDCGGMRTAMTKMGRPKAENSKKKMISIRVDDSLYARICAYAEKHQQTVTEVVLQGLDKQLSKPE